MVHLDDVSVDDVPDTADQLGNEWHYHKKLQKELQ
jgi:hypothetical protein